MATIVAPEAELPAVYGGQAIRWACSGTGSGVGVAVVDTGIDLARADLEPVATACYTAWQDDNGHGTS